MSTLEDLALLVVAFCQAKGLDLDLYVEGMLSGGPLDDRTVATLTRYHTEWLG